MISDKSINTAVASHTHLFPGAVLRIAGNSAFEPKALKVSFSDGSQTQAELVFPLGGPESNAALIVDAYTTAAGTSIPQKMWHVAGQSTACDALDLRIGPSLPFE